MIQTAEAMSNGHPDKVADIIADSVVDACLKEDPEAICGIKTLVSRNLIVVSGELGIYKTPDIERIVRKSLSALGFDGQREKFNALTCKIQLACNDYNFELARRHVGEIHEQGAPDQCLAIGYACDETNLLLPAAPVFARALIDQLAAVRPHFPYLRLDAKSLVSVETNTFRPRVRSIVLSTEHEPGFDVSKIRADMREAVIDTTLRRFIDKNTKIYINPIGPFENAGPYAETGLSGRKVVVDAYGDRVPVGGGAFSGKDPSKCDRSASYYARLVAKSVVANDFATACTVKLSYCIGLSNPCSLEIETKENSIPPKTIEEKILEHFDFKPRSIYNQLRLHQVSYEEITKKGHFGRLELPWEVPRYLQP